MEKYHKLFLVSQERYNKINNLCSSGGGQSLKDDSEFSDSMFSDQESVCLRDRNSSGQSSNGTVTENEDQNNNDHGKHTHLKDSMLFLPHSRKIPRSL